MSCFLDLMASPFLNLLEMSWERVASTRPCVGYLLEGLGHLCESVARGIGGYNGAHDVPCVHDLGTDSLASSTSAGDSLSDLRPTAGCILVNAWDVNFSCCCCCFWIESIIEFD